MVDDGKHFITNLLFASTACLGTQAPGYDNKDFVYSLKAGLHNGDNRSKLVHSKEQK